MCLNCVCYCPEKSNKHHQQVDDEKAHGRHKDAGETESNSICISNKRENRKERFVLLIIIRTLYFDNIAMIIATVFIAFVGREKDVRNKD